MYSNNFKESLIDSHKNMISERLSDKFPEYKIGWVYSPIKYICENNNLIFDDLKKYVNIGENMEIEKKETMSLEEFIERKDDTFIKAKINVNEEKRKKYYGEYGRFLLPDYNIGFDSRIKLYTKAIKIHEEVIPFDFIENIEVTIKY